MEQIEIQATDLRHLTETSLGPVPGPSSRLGWPGVPMESPRPLGREPNSKATSSAPVGDNSAFSTRASHSPDADDTSTSVPTKRKGEADDTTPKQQRSKRNRYIAIACNECKRRKIKCNGETPCHRCGNLNLKCQYSTNCCSNNFRDSDEYRQMADKMRLLEGQVSSLAQSVSSLRQETQRLAPLQDRILPIPSTVSSASSAPSSAMAPSIKSDLAPLRPAPIFRGPTSIAFTVGVAKNTLHNMDYGNEDAPEDAAGDTPGFAEETARSSPAARPLPPDPLWEFDRDEMVRLCRVHEDEVGIMYPVVKIEMVMGHVYWLSSWMDAARRGGFEWPANYDETMASVSTLLLKIIMCSALAVEEHGHSERAIRLYDSMQPVIDRKLMTEPSDIGSLPLLALVAGYRFLTNDEILAWRVIGQVARLCLEQGLHRREGLAKIANEQDRKNAINTFWSAYVLDRRWSFGTGLPFVLQDDKIDPGLPFPDEYPYLVAMVTYSRLGAKIWRLVDVFEPAIVRDLPRDEVEALDQEILQWYESVPDEAKISTIDPDLPLPQGNTYDLQRLKVWTRLRLNQMRLWLHTPVLHSASSITANMCLAQRAVNLAKETIQYLSSLNNSSNVYRRIQVFYHQFLTSAIAVLFLASTHQPVQFSSQCREEFYLATNLICDMSAKSFVSQRLWTFVRSLKAYASRVGLVPLDERERDRNRDRDIASSLVSNSRTGSVAASPYVQPWTLPPQQQQQQQMPPSAVYGRVHLPSMSSTASPAPTSTPDRQPDQYFVGGSSNGTQLKKEMMRIFEGYVSINGFLHDTVSGTAEDRRLFQSENNLPDGSLYDQAKMF